MGSRLWAVAVAGAVLAACGGGPSSAPTPPGGPSGPTGPDGSTGPSGTAGGGTGGATPPSAPPPSANPPSTTPADACAGLLPDAPGPGVGYVAFDATSGTCDQPITDGHGEWIGVGSGNKAYAYAFVSATAPGAPTTSALYGRYPFDNRPVLAPQPDGYQQVDTRDGMPGPFQRWDAQGDLLATGDRSSEELQGLPGGGSVVNEVPGWTPSGGGDTDLVWMSAAGDEVAHVPHAQFVAVSSTGNVLAISASGLRWYDRNGAPVTDWFADPVDYAGAWRANGGKWDWALALADGSVVVWLGTDHAARIAAGATRASPVPDWVQARAGAVFANVRGGHANAFATLRPAGAGCEADVEILTAAGESCGTVRLQSPDPCQRVSIGADCTVFTTSTSASRQCAWHWWSGLLR